MWHKVLFLCVIICVLNGTSAINEEQLLSLPVQDFKREYNYEVHDGHRVSQNIKDRLGNMKNLLRKLQMSDTQHDRTTPVIKWAQSQNQIYLSFKLSHRQDSPPCSHTTYQQFQYSNIESVEADCPAHLNQNLNLENLPSINFQGQCFFTHQKLLFTLDLSYKNAVSKLIIKKDGLGAYTLIASKAIPGIWLQPFTQFKKASIWTEMRDKFQSDMDEYFEILQNLNSSNEKRRKKKYRKKNKTIQSIKKTQSDIKVNKNDTETQKSQNMDDL